MLESTLLKHVRALGVGAVRLFRNNTGVLVDREGKHVRYGLCNGSSDLIGFKTITITPQMVGRRVAVFVAIETKTQFGRVQDDQQRFIDAVQAAGGIAGVARSVDQARDILNETP